LREHSVIEEARLAGGAFEPVEQLGGRIDLVVVLAVGKVVSSARYWASHGARSGRCTKPF
jgi:hypothetical protein